MDVLELFVYALIAAFIIFIVKIFLKNIQTKDDTFYETGLLFAYYTNEKELMVLDAGKLDDVYYRLFLTTSNNDLQQPEIISSGSGAILYKLELPFSLQTHIIGITKTDHTDEASLKLYVATSNMQEVTLEGDFPNYFSLYSDNANSSLTQYVFDPEAMEFVVNYCTSHNWEINNNELYFTVATDQDTEAIIKNSIDFIEQIKPALITNVNTDDINVHRMPYGEYRGKPLQCPICSTEMKYVENWHECVNGHGRLMHARKLLAVKNNSIKVAASEASTLINRSNNLTCPFCSNQMQQTQYLKKDLIIDSCTKCAYRWLDAGELAKVSPL